MSGNGNGQAKIESKTNRLLLSEGNGASQDD
jgi:hypothetical protein